MKSLFASFSCLRPGWALFLAALLTQSAFAQKITDTKVWTAIHRSPRVTLAPYKTYAVAYDFGALPVPIESPPALSGLQLQPAAADLLLKITVRDLYIAKRNLMKQTDSKTSQVTGYNYVLTCAAEYGYELIDQQTHQLLLRYHNREYYGTETNTYPALAPLNEYVQTAYLPAMAKGYLRQVLNQLALDMAPHDYRVELTINNVEGGAPAYADISQQTAALVALLVSPTPDKAQLAACAAGWEKHLARVNWDDKKSEINKNVANALLNNLCAAYLLAENYAKVQQYGRLFAFYNNGLFSKTWPAFQQEDITNNPAAASLPPGSKAAKAYTSKVDYLAYANGMLTH